MRVQQETTISAKSYDIRDRLISFLVSALFCCLGRVDINYLFLWLFYDLRKSTQFFNRIFSMKSTLFRNTKSHLFFRFKQTFLNVWSYSESNAKALNYTMSVLSRINHVNSSQTRMSCFIAKSVMSISPTGAVFGFNA